MLRIHKFISFYILFFVTSSILSGQIYTDNNIIYEEANGYFQGREFEEALPLFLQLERKGISNANINYKIGMCYLEIPGKRLQAIPFLEAAADYTSSKYVNSIETEFAPIDAFLALAEVYQLDHKFDKALNTLQCYKDSIGDDKNQLANFRIKQAEIAEYYTSNPNEGKLSLVNPPRSYSIYNPVLVSDSTLFYMEDRPFYEAAIKGSVSNNEINEVDNLIPMIGTEEELTINSVSSDGKTIVFTAYIAGKGNELLFSEIDENGVWSKIDFFPEPINTPNNENFASFTKEKDILYFSSNRSGGYGGSDIYSITRGEDGIWRDPVNLGPKINTPFSENLCYISPDGKTLLLNSQGHLSMGGYDFYISHKDDNGKWTDPVNLGYPVSSVDDDNFISINNNGEVLTSRYNEEVTDKQNIYFVNLDKNLDKKKVFVRNQLKFSKKIPAKKVTYTIIDQKTGKTELTSATKISGSTLNLLSEGSYKYQFNYNDTISAHQEVVISPTLSAEELTLEPPVWEVVYSTAVPSNVMAETNDILVLYDVLFEFDSYKIKSNYYSLLDSVAMLLNKYSQINIKVEGHTDALGSKTYNQILSERRAKEVGEYLKEKGVSISQLNTVGKGEGQPVAINNNLDGSDNIQGRKYNRRVTITLDNRVENVDIKEIRQIPLELKK